MKAKCGKDLLEDLELAFSDLLSIGIDSVSINEIKDVAKKHSVHYWELESFVRLVTRQLI